MGFFKTTKAENTAAFYKDLVSGKRTRLFWGKQRFDTSKVLGSASIKKYFEQPVSTLIKPDDTVLDLGCGSGMFLPLIAPLCSRLVGIEISPQFVKLSRDVVKKFNLENTSIIETSSEKIPFNDDEVDVVILVDVLHHLYHVDETLLEIRRVLKQGGLVIVYEPNKLNFILYIMCLLDRNEWGLLSLGRKGIYRRLLEKYFSIDSMVYNGLLIGPDNKLNVAIAGFLNLPLIRHFLGWLSPKILITLHKPEETK